MVPGWQGTLALALVAVALTGCIDDAPVVVADEATPPTGSARATAVVADYGTGAAYYHHEHRRPTWTEHPSAVIPGFPTDAPAIHLTFGPDLEANIAADADAWAGVQPGIVHWIPGTNLLVLILEPWAFLGPLPDAGIHGVLTAGAVSKACPECYVLTLQDNGGIGGRAVQHVADHLPWVDLVTSTAGYTPTTVYGDATRALHDNGGLFFAPSGNDPVSGTRIDIVGYSNQRPWSWPPWVVMVGGAYGDCSAVETLAGKPTEFVSEFAQTLPLPDAMDAYGQALGTSFSTPKAAAHFAQVLQRLRAEHGPGDGPDARIHGGTALWSGAAGAGLLSDGRLDAEELRSAFVASARWFGTSDHQPGCAPLDPGANAPAPASPTPWVEMGWGHVDQETATAAYRVVTTNEPVDSRGAAANAWMDAFTTLRENAWNVG